MNIGISLCEQLASRGYDVIALGMGYKSEHHPYPFKIVPIDKPQSLMPVVVELKKQSVEVEAIIVALDIPLQIGILNQINAPNQDIPYIGLFPLESGPLCQTWAMHLLRMDYRLIMSQFGKDELAKMHITSDFLPLGVGDAWFIELPAFDGKQKLRKGMGINEDAFVVLTVADNQERKNLSKSLEIFAEFSKDRPNSLYYMVTRPNSPVGWRLEDYATKLGIMDKLAIWERGLDFKSLWSLYAIADCMLLTSKREGLAMPILESMAMKLVCVGTDCAAIKEHLSDNRGFLIDTEYEHIDPWGNSVASMASLRDGADQLKMIYGIGDHTKMLDKAHNYVKSRTWKACGDILEKAIKTVEKEPVKVPIPEGMVV